jgi:Glycosyltransferase
MGKKRILVMVDWFKPGYKAGGPIQSCANFAFSLKNDYDIWVLTTDTDHGEQMPYSGIPANKWITNLSPAIQVYYARKQTLTLRQLKEQIKKVDADYIYLNHLYSPKFVVYPLLLKYLGVIKSQIVLCPRGALYDSAIAIKSFKKKVFIRVFRWLRVYRFVRFHATNEREKNAILRHFPGSEVLIADNLPQSDQQPLKTCEKQPGVVKCVFIARILPIKNLLYLLQVLHHVKNSVILTVAGPIEDEAYWKECQAVICQLPQHVQVNYIGAVNNDEVSGIIREHHVFVLPTKGENFGHSIFESLLAGRPVIISDQTPWLNLDQYKSGWDLSLEKPEDFKDAIEKTAQMNQHQFDEWAKGAWDYASRFIANPALKTQYYHLFS